MWNNKFFKLIFSFLVLGIGAVYILIQIANLTTYQNKEIDCILEKTAAEINNIELSDISSGGIEKGAFISIFTKDDNGKMTPLIYDKGYFSNGINDPIWTYKTYKKLIRIYENTISGNNFVVWINKFNYNLYIKYIFIPFLIVLLIYIIGIIMIGLFLPETTERLDDDDEFERELYRGSIPTDESEEDGSDNCDTEEINDNDGKELDIHDSYKDLWVKNFKISDNFRTTFPFAKLTRLLRFSYQPEEYINRCVITATEFFKWEYPRVYIAQVDEFIESRTKEVLDKNLISIPEDGNVKGDIYIPLYPYNKNKIFGYLAFSWKNEFPFFISDILYFLKFIFSSEARAIFINYKNNNNLKDRIAQVLEQNEDLTVGFVEVDGKEKYKIDLSQDERNILNLKILDDITQGLSGAVVFEAFQFVYGFFKPVATTEIKEALEIFSSKNNSMNYYISPSRGNIAVTFSAGIASKRGRKISHNELLTEAEDYLNISVESGGDQITGK